MERKNRVNVRLNEAEMRQLNSLAAELGETQSGTFRTLLFLNDRIDIFTDNQKKSGDEIASLKAEVSALKNQIFQLEKWLKDHIE